MDNKKPITGFVIPKKRKAEVPLPELVSEDSASSSISSEMPPEGYEIAEATEEEKEQLLLLMDKRKTNPSNTEESWKLQQIKTVEIIKNARLEYNFEEYKKRIKSEEVMGYRVVYEREEAEKIAELGVSVRSDCVIDISELKEGVMMYNSPSLSYPGRFLYTNVPITVIVFRVAEGKRNEIPISSGIIPASKQHQCHVVMNTDALKNYNPFTVERMLGGVFHYEYFEDLISFHKYPGMILPHAIITYTLSPDAVAPPPGSVPEKFCKIHKTHLSFDLSDGCGHTIIMPGSLKKYEANLCKTVITNEVAYILVNSECRPRVVQMKYLAECYPELSILRTGPDFGQLLKRENTYIAGYGSYCHYVLRFRNKPTFMEKLTEHNCFLVWEPNEEWTVFYLPTGKIAAEFGFPHQSNCFHLVVYRRELQVDDMEVEWSRNILSGDDEEYDRTPAWTFSDDIDRIPADAHEFDDEVFDEEEEEGDEGEVDEVANDGASSSTPAFSPDSTTPFCASPDISLPSVTLNASAAQYIPTPSPTFGSSPRLSSSSSNNPTPSPILSTPGPSITPDSSANSSTQHTPAEISSSPSTFVPKGILRKIGSKPKNLKIRFVDWKYPDLPNHVPGNLVAERIIENDNVFEAHNTGMTFAEKLRQDHINEAKLKKEQVKQLEDEKKERTEKGTDELFKNAMTGTREVSEINRPAVLQNSAPSASTSSCNTSIPPPSVPHVAPSISSPPTSSVPPLHIPSTFSQPPPKLTSPVSTHTVIPFQYNRPPPFSPVGVPPPSFPTNIPPPNRIAVPPPNFNSFQPPNFSSPPPPIIANLTTPPPQVPAIPGLSFPMPPPPKIPHNYKVPSPQGIPPPALVTPILSSVAAKTSTDSHPPSSVALLTRPPMPVAIPPALQSAFPDPRRPSPDVEIGEEPMEIDDDDDEDEPVETKKEETPNDAAKKEGGDDQVMLPGDESVRDVKAEEPKEEPNDILEMAFQQARPEPAKIPSTAQKTSSIDALRGSRELIALLAVKNAQGKAQASLQDTDLRSVQARPVNFSIASKPPATMPLSNVLMTNDEEEEEGTSSSNDKQAGSSKDSDYRTPARRISHESYSRDRDDRPHDRDDRVSQIPIPKQSPQAESNKRVDNILQERLRATDKDREKRANETANMASAMAMLPGTFKTMFPSIAIHYQTQEGYHGQANVAPSIQPGSSSAAPAPVAAVTSTEPQRYTPTTIFNLHHPPNESEQEDKYREEGGTSSGNAVETSSQKKSPKKPKDYDSVEASASDERVRQTWLNTTTAPKQATTASKPPVQEKEIEYITLDDSDVEEGEIDREPVTTRKTLLPRPQQFPQRQQFRGGGAYRGLHGQRGGHQGFFNQTPLPQQQEDPLWNAMMAKPDKNADYYLIIVNEKDDSITPNEWNKLFEGLLKVKQRPAQLTPRIQPTIYIHDGFLPKKNAASNSKSSGTEYCNRNEVFTKFMETNPPLVRQLPNHSSCQGPIHSVRGCVPYFHDVRKAEETIYLTNQHSEHAEYLVGRGVKVMTIRELRDHIEQRTGESII